MIPYCSLGSRLADAEKIPVVLFASGYKEQVWKQYNGLVLLEFNRLANRAEARRLRDEITKYNQPLLAFIGSSGLSVKVVVRCRWRKRRRLVFMHMPIAGRHCIIRRNYSGRSISRSRRSTGDAACRSIRSVFITRSRCLSGWNSR